MFMRILGGKPREEAIKDLYPTSSYLKSPAERKKEEIERQLETSSNVLISELKGEDIKYLEGLRRSWVDQQLVSFEEAKTELEAAGQVINLNCFTGIPLFIRKYTRENTKRIEDIIDGVGELPKNSVEENLLRSLSYPAEAVNPSFMDNRARISLTMIHYLTFAIKGYVRMRRPQTVEKMKAWIRIDCLPEEYTTLIWENPFRSIPSNTYTTPSPELIRAFFEL